MNNIISAIDIGTNVISLNIFKKIIYNRIQNIIKIVDKEDIKVTIDFSQVTFISLEVLTKLLVLGNCSRAKGVKIQINLDYKSELKNYLEESGFIESASTSNSLLFENAQIGYVQKEKNENDFKYSKWSQNYEKYDCVIQVFEKDELIEQYEENFTFSESTFFLEKIKEAVEYYIVGDALSRKIFSGYKLIMSKEDFFNTLFDKLTRYMKITSAILLENRSQIDLKDLYDYGKAYSEMIQNGLIHTEGIVVFGIQSFFSKKRLTSQIEASISDCGEGYYKTLYEKFNINEFNENNEKKQNIGHKPRYVSEKEFLGFKDDFRKNYYSIFEAILYRLNDPYRGIWDILCFVREAGNLDAEIIIQNNDLQIAINKLELEKLVKDIIVKDSEIDMISVSVAEIDIEIPTYNEIEEQNVTEIEIDKQVVTEDEIKRQSDDPEKKYISDPERLWLIKERKAKEHKAKEWKAKLRKAKVAKIINTKAKKRIEILDRAKKKESNYKHRFIPSYQGVNFIFRAYI